MKFSNYVQTCKALIWCDLAFFKQNLFDKTIDLAIWSMLTIFVTGYIMPYFGLNKDFGLVQFGGVLAAAGIFELYGSVVELISDLEGNRVIQYNLTAPIPTVYALASKIIYYFCVYLILTLIVLPLGKVCLWYQWDLKQSSLIRLTIAILIQNIFYACAVLWIAALIKSIGAIGSIWSRIIFPLWFMGGFQFSWMSLHHVAPYVAYVNLLNPLTYITEMMRASLDPASNTLPFSICAVAVLLFSIVLFYLSIYSMRKRLDFV